jgi:alkanesulfonate monooxygenase SsuD/methylene tetrahydromethanopterin reductase-like flavin-dependent oxidoreductase (luciferase family)
MPKFCLNFDMRAPDFGKPAAELYAAAMEMTEYGDKVGIDDVSVQEHHAAEDGYISSPFVLGAAFAARSKRMRIQLGAVILPFHDPIKVAEQIAILDLISNGRLDVVFGIGYAQHEFDMFGVSLKDRVPLLEKGVRLIQRALTGEPFVDDGRNILVRPAPVQKPTPPLFAGGRLEATARRAARLGMNLYPLKMDIVPFYLDECKKLGKQPGKVIGNVGQIHVTEDPDKTWAIVAPHVAHVARTYAQWGSNPNYASLFKGLDSMEELRKNGSYKVVTPDEAVALCAEADKTGRDIGLAPLVAGLDPKIGWEGLELFVKKVLPRVRKAA